MQSCLGFLGASSIVLHFLHWRKFCRKLLKPQKAEGSFLNGFSRLRQKLAPTPVLDLAFLAPTRELAPTEVLKNCPLERLAAVYATAFCCFRPVAHLPGKIQF
jgi:hypothetical protein